MIIELSLELNPNEFFLASCELSEDIWDKKEKEIKDFLHNTVRSYEGNFKINETNEPFPTIQYFLIGKPNLFFNTQNRVEEYINTLGGKTLVV